jgi:hypothetical protein
MEHTWDEAYGCYMVQMVQNLEYYIDQVNADVDFKP